MDDLSQVYAAICHLKFPTEPLPGSIKWKHALNETTIVTGTNTLYDVDVHISLLWIYFFSSSNENNDNDSMQPPKLKGQSKHLSDAIWWLKYDDF